MISENQTQSVEVPTVEKKNGAPKRNYKKKEPKTVETVAIVAKAKPKREKKQPSALSKPSEHTSDVDEEYTKIKNLIDSNPDVAQDIQNIIKKYIK